MLIIGNRHQKRCEERLKVAFQKLDKKNPMYSKLDIRITALPCHLDKGDFSFFVSINPTDKLSVFILSRNVDAVTGEKDGRVLQHVRDIALLKYANNIY